MINILAGKIPKDCVRSSSLYLRHYRYYYDPPEFQTVIASAEPDPALFHIGYFRYNIFLRNSPRALDKKTNKRLCTKSKNPNCFKTKLVPRRPLWHVFLYNNTGAVGS